MNLIYGRFKEFLQQQGIREIDSINQDFNTDFHEAVTTIPVSDENLKGKVVDVIEKGYYLHDKVIRYPKVVIGE
jgi:molecular chaperone GrpE